MLLISVILWSYKIYVIESATENEWPFCSNSAFAKGYPIGCKYVGRDTCAHREAQCREFICNQQWDDLEICQDACNTPPFPSTVRTDFLECACEHLPQPICLERPALPARASHTSLKSHKYFHLPSIQTGGSNIWGVSARVIGESGALFATFCYGDAETCKKLPEISCKQGPCPSANDCFFDHGFCFHTEEHTQNGICESGKPASIETAEEWQFISYLGFHGELGNINEKIATAGFIPATTFSIIWNGWEDASSAFVLSLINGDLDRISLSTRDQILYYAFWPVTEHQYVFGSDVFIDIWSVVIPTILCKLAVDEAKCSKVDQYGELWDCGNSFVCEKRCPLGARGTATWECNGTNFKTDWPVYSECQSSWIADLNDLLESNGATSVEVMMYLDNYLKASSLFGHEMMSTLNFTKISLNLMIEEQSESDDLPEIKLFQRKLQSNLAMGVIDDLLSLEIPLAQLNEEKKIELGNEMQDVTESFGFTVTQKAAEIGEPYRIYSKFTNYHMEAQYILVNQNNKSGPIIQFPFRDDSAQSRIFINELPSAFSMGKTNTLPIEVVASHMTMEAADVLFSAQFNSFNDTKKRLNSGMISMTLRHPKQNEIHNFSSDNAVTIVFKHERKAKGPYFSNVNHELYPGEEPTAIQESAKCVYWNKFLGKKGQWDSEGCRLLNSSHWYTTCECNHLSSFALLMDVHTFIATSRALEILGIVCSSLSVICLALTILALYILRLGTRQVKVGKHLCICLMIGHVMALIFLDRSYFNTPQDICVAIGVFTHYIFLAAFTWMTIEGHNLYLKVVKVFDTGRDYSRIYLIIGYGTPLIIVAITGIVTACMQDNGYGNDALCWLSTPGYVWAFIGPMLCSVTINFIILIMSMKIAISASRKQKKKLASRIKIWLSGWFSLSALLGVTWIFGFLYIQVDPNFAYVFIILNGCQGVLLFLTRVVFNKNVRSGLRDIIKRRELLSQFYGLSEATESRAKAKAFGSTAASKLDITASSSQNKGLRPDDSYN